MSVAPDGSPVDLYLRLSGAHEAEIITSVVPSTASILELGAGAGRVTRELTRRGFDVTAVDNEREMLRHIRGARTVLADIMTLDLDRRFDAVLLCSHFVNTPNTDERRALLATCARHVAPEGIVIVERYPRGWTQTIAPNSRTVDGVTIEARDIERTGDHVLTMTISYEIDGRRFDQRFSAVDVEDEQLARDAATANLRIDRLITDDATWVTLRYATP